jgi:hypothetical protein
MSCTKHGHRKIHLKKLNYGEVKEKYQITITNKIVALETEDKGDINRA